MIFVANGTHVTTLLHSLYIGRVHLLRNSTLTCCVATNLGRFWVHADDSSNSVFSRRKRSVSLDVVENRANGVKFRIWSHVTPCSYMKL